MIADDQTDQVFISSLLCERYPDIHCALEKIFGDKLATIEGTKDIWARDYMPIQIDTGQFVQFCYDPDYLENHLAEKTQDAAALLPMDNCQRSPLIIDGGNVVRWRDTLIMTDKIFNENGCNGEDRLLEELQRTLKVDRLIVVPKEPYDTFGHTDGMVRFVDGNTLLVNDYDGVDPKFGLRKFGDELEKSLAGFTLVPFPYRPTEEQNADRIWSAKGLYINFLQTADTIVYPTFDLPEDAIVRQTLERVFPQYAPSRIFPLECNGLAKGGGVLNCVTWNVKGPVR